MILIKKIEIENVGCIKHMEIKPSNTLTTIEGRNGVGKSTILNALRYILESGHDPTLLRTGAQKGAITITLDDGCQLVVTITPEKTTRVVKHPKYGKISKAREWVESIINSVSFDPAGFLTAKPAERVSIFLRALPKKLTAEQLAFIPCELLGKVDLNDHALEVIGSNTSGLYGDIYTERREVNRTAKEKAATIAEMERTLPPAPLEGNWQAALDTVTEKISKLQEDTEEHINGADDIYRSAEASYNLEAAQYEGLVNTELARLKAAMEKEYLAKVQEAERQHAEVIAVQNRQRDRLIAEAAKKKGDTLAAIETGYQPQLQALSQERGRTLAMVEQTANSQAAQKYIETLRSELDKAGTRADELTDMLRQLDNLKAGLLTGIPIAGLEIADGQLLVNSLPFDRINDSEKNRIAVEIMRLHHGELGLMVLDRAEIFDSNSWEAFKTACKAAGMQILAARVTDSELVVRGE